MALRQHAARGRVAVVAVVAVSLLGLVGCAADRPELVPSSAVLKAQGNDRVVYVAENAGNVWVADKDVNAIVYSGRLNPGDRLLIDTKENLVTVNDRAVVTKELQRRDYKIFFQPGYAVPAGARVASDRDRDSRDRRPDGVPASASVVGEGRNRLEYTAAEDGEIWIANSDRNSLEYGGRVVRGEQVVIDPDKDILDVGSRTVMAKPKDIPADNHRIYFMRSIDRPRTILTPTPAPAPRTSGAVITTPAPVTVIERPADIPASAAVMRSEIEDRTDVTAIDPGTAWVVNAANQTVYSTRLKPGDKLTVDPVGDQILLNGARAYDGTLTAGRYRVFFEKATR
jgi:hypothetical protein